MVAATTTHLYHLRAQPYPAALRRHLRSPTLIRGDPMLESELAALLECTGDAAYAVTEDGTIRAWNGAAERLFGHARATVIGRHIDAVLHPRDALGTAPLGGGMNAVLRRVTPGNPLPDFDLEVVTGAGSRLWVNVSTLVVEQRGRPGRLIVRLARDISARRTRDALLERMIGVARELAAIPNRSVADAPVAPLTAQERRILSLLARGRSPDAVTRELEISAQTLRNHLHRINRKLRTSTRLEAVTHAQQRGLID